MNWGSLKQLARTYVHRSDLDFDALQPLAWSNISIALVVPENEAMSVVTLSGPDDKTLFSGALPVDYALMRAVSQTGRTLNPVDIKMLIERGGSRYAVSGLKIFSISAGDCSLVYSQRLQPVLDDESSNIILDHYPDICLYGLLKHAAAIVQDPEVNAEFYEQQFLGAVKTANSIYIDAAFGPGTAATPMGGMM
jgi:hypothetical protein